MTHNIIINGIEYIYSIKKSKRARYIRLQIDLEGSIQLTVPHNISVERGILFVENKRTWLEKRLKLIGKSQNNFRYFGSEIALNLQYHLFIDSVRYYFNDNKLKVVIPTKSNLTKENIFDAWLFQQAKEYIPKRVEILAQRNNFNYNSVRVKKLKSRWGSCSSRGNLSFNHKIMYFESKTIDYVIIHELCHLKEMNHSKKFWNLVESLFPDYKDWKIKLVNL